MRVMKFLGVMTLGLSVATTAVAEEDYIIKSGDTLSTIIKGFYPEKRLYGPSGKFYEVLSLNPQIKNPHLIFPHHVVRFNPEANPLPVEAPQNTELEDEAVADPVAPQIDRKLSFIPGLDEWNISFLYGAKYLSVNQTGALGRATAGVLFINDLQLNSEFIFEDWTFNLQFDSYKFKYDSLNAGQSKQMYSLDAFVTYKWMLGGVSVEQNPLFRELSGDVEMPKQSVVSLSFGGKKDIDLPTKKPSQLKLKSWVRVPVATGSDTSQVELSHVNGAGIRGQAELTREFLARDNYSLHGMWLTDVGYQRISQEVKWGVSSGRVRSLIFNGSTSLGLQLKF